MKKPGFFARMRSANSFQNACGIHAMVSTRNAAAPWSIHCSYAPTRYSIIAGLFSLKSDNCAKPPPVL